MSSPSTRRSVELAADIALVVAIALVVFRASVWLFFEHAHFDADQAVTGLMAKHLIEGRAWPLLFYGQHYMLAVEAWLVAPFVGVLGLTVFSVRLPLVLLNIVVALLLVRRLQVDAGLKPWAALVAASFFLVPGPVTSSRLVDAMGAAIEPFVYILLLWMLRGRPAWFGLVAGVGIVHREFTAYAVAAIWMLEAWHGRVFGARQLRAKVVVMGEILAVSLLVTLLKPYADLLGPGTGGTFGPEVLGGQAEFILSRFCVSPAELGQNLSWLFRENLSTLFGYREGPYGLFVSSRLSGGTWWAWMPLAVACGAGVAAAVVSRRSTGGVGMTEGGVPARAFPWFLILVGVLALVVYAGINCDVRELPYVRYTLLAVFIPVGLVALALQPGGIRATAAIAVGATIVVTALAAYEDARVLDEFRRRRPSNDYRMLADFLEREGVRYGRAPYWTAYRTVFLTDERVLITAHDKLRVREYEDAVAAHADQAVDIFVDEPCTDPGAVAVGRWCILHLERVRGAR